MSKQAKRRALNDWDEDWNGYEEENNRKERDRKRKEQRAAKSKYSTTEWDETE